MAGEPSGSSRGDENRERTVATAIDVFGRHGVEGASTRKLVAAAGANIQAIQYHFGGKEGLYLAVAGEIGPVQRQAIAGMIGQAVATLPGADQLEPSP